MKVFNFKVPQTGIDISIILTYALNTYRHTHISKINFNVTASIRSTRNTLDTQTRDSKQETVLGV